MYFGTEYFYDMIPEYLEARPRQQMKFTFHVDSINFHQDDRTHLAIKLYILHYVKSFHGRSNYELILKDELELVMGHKFWIKDLAIHLNNSYVDIYRHDILENNLGMDVNATFTQDKVNRTFALMQEYFERLTSFSTWTLDWLLS